MATLAVTKELLDRGRIEYDIENTIAVAASTQMDFRNDGNLILLVFSGTTGTTLTLKGQPDPYGRPR
jgi:hypothetical protein